MRKLLGCACLGLLVACCGLQQRTAQHRSAGTQGRRGARATAAADDNGSSDDEPIDVRGRCRCVPPRRRHVARRSQTTAPSSGGWPTSDAGSAPKAIRNTPPIGTKMRSPATRRCSRTHKAATRKTSSITWPRPTTRWTIAKRRIVYLDRLIKEFPRQRLSRRSALPPRANWRFRTTTMTEP